MNTLNGLAILILLLIIYNYQYFDHIIKLHLATFWRIVRNHPRVLQPDPRPDHVFGPSVINQSAQDRDVRRLGNNKSTVAQLYSQHTGVFTSACFSACTSYSCVIVAIAHVLCSYFLFLISTAMSRAFPLTPCNVIH